MSVGPEAFGEDYLYFYETWLTDEVAERQTELLWRLLALEPGAAVLDVACGHGRIANRLAERGAAVTGLDADPFFLAKAQEAGSSAEYVEGDMRALPFADARFDATLLWFTSLGYFDDEGNRAVLRELRRVLRPGGRAVLDLNHLPRLLATFQRQSFVRRGVDALLDEHGEFAEHTRTMETTRTYIRKGSVREVRFRVRYFLPEELREWLLAAGFEEIALLGPAGEPLTPESRRLIAVAQAPS
ncbi:MAG TPA: methyltransferase domain-containing protein [Gaiellaceae bacterium]|nr:methyltransferase domain-containing protein [Gaiellaceae bacterium]